MRLAFLYSRFSTSEQLHGRSLNRQYEAAKAFCARHGWKLDERSFSDLGVSAYHGANATHGELAVFLELVNDGRIPEGSVLIVENIDRITRLPPAEAVALISGIVKAGVDVATISPEYLYTAGNIDRTETFLPLSLGCCLAAEESRKKGERLADAWESKRKTAGAVKLTVKGPAWLRLAADRLSWEVVEQKADWVRRAFALSLEGHGVTRIAAVLNQEAPEGLTGKGWQPGYIRDLLRSRSVLGEYQPHVGTCAKKGRKKTRKPQGEPVKGYFPAVVSEADFYRVQAGLDERKKGGGRMTGVPNLFNGLLCDASDGRRMVMNAARGKRTLVSGGAVRGLPGSVYRPLNYRCFERAVLKKLAELKPADVLDRPGAAEDRVTVLSGKLTVVKRNLDATRKRAGQADDSTVFFELLDDLEQQFKELVKAREAAKAEAASQGGDNLGHFIGLVELLDAAGPDDLDALRSKLRAALRRLVESMHVLIVPVGQRKKPVALQVVFRGGKVRHYLMIAGPVRSDEDWSVESATFDAALDLRNSDHVRRLSLALSQGAPVG